MLQLVFIVLIVKVNETDDDDHDDDDELFLRYVFPVGTILIEPHYRESLARREQDLNMRRT